MRSIRFKIHAVIRSMVVCLLVLATISLAGVGVLAWTVHQELTVIGPAQRANAAVLQGMTDSESSVRGFQLTRDDTFLGTWTLAQGPLDENLGMLEGLLRSSAIGPAVARQANLVAQWRTVYAAPVATGRMGSLDRSQQVAARLAFERFRNENAGIAQWILARREGLGNLSTAAAAITALALVVAGALGMTVGLRPARRALQGVAPPLEALHEVVEDLQNGHWDRRADPDAGVVEIRAVARALNELAAGHQRTEERALEELRLIAAERDWARSIHAVPGLDELVPASLGPMADALHADAIWMRLFELSSDTPDTGISGVHPEDARLDPVPAELISAVRDLAQLCWSLHRPLVLTPGAVVPLAPGLATVMLDYASRVGIETLLFVPVGSGKQAIGYLSVGRRKDSPRWTELEVNAAERMARELGRVVLSARAAAREQLVIAELRALDARKSEFLATVSHELRTPLASVTGHLEIVRSGDLGEVNSDIDHSLAAIERNSARLTQLIEDLLLLSRIEESSAPSTMTMADLSRLVNDSVAQLRPEAQRSGIPLVLSGTEVARPIECDPHEIERLVTNLLSNAIKFSRPGDAVELSVITAVRPDGGDAVRIVVRDRGIGMSQEDLAMAFNWFFRSASAQALAVPGTGLGLAIVKIIAERHGGTVAADSAEGAGSTFVVELPLTRAGGQQEWIGRQRLQSMTALSASGVQLSS